MGKLRGGSKAAGCTGADCVGEVLGERRVCRPGRYCDSGSGCGGLRRCGSCVCSRQLELARHRVMRMRGHVACAPKLPTSKKGLRACRDECETFNMSGYTATKSCQSHQIFRPEADQSRRMW